MTQTQHPGPVAWTVVGKDRLTDEWHTEQFTDAHEATRWEAERAFTLPDEIGRTIRPIYPPRVRVEWLINGEWQAYSAWYAPDQRAHLDRMVTQDRIHNPANTFRVAEEIR